MAYCLNTHDSLIYDEKEHWEVERDLRDGDDGATHEGLEERLESRRHPPSTGPNRDAMAHTWNAIYGALDREHWKGDMNCESAAESCLISGTRIRCLESAHTPSRSASQITWKPSAIISQIMYDFCSYHVRNDTLREYIKAIFLDDMKVIKDALMKPTSDHVPRGVDPNANKFVKTIEYVGSSFEKTDIKAPGVEFDIMLIMDGNELLEADNIKNHPGFVTLKPNNSFHLCSSSDKAKQLIYNSMAVSPMEIRSKVCGEIQKIINTSPRLVGLFQCYYHGPALQFDRYCGVTLKKLYSVDIVPAYELETTEVNGGKQIDLFVAKTPKKPGRADLISMAWQRSCAVKERDKIANLSNEQRVAYQICKHILYKSDELKKMSTYHLKNAFLQEININADQRMWAPRYVVQRVLDIWKRICFQLEEKQMPVYFAPDVNLIEHMKDTTRVNMICRIVGFF